MVPPFFGKPHAYSAYKLEDIRNILLNMDNDDDRKSFLTEMTSSDKLLAKLTATIKFMRHGALIDQLECLSFTRRIRSFQDKFIETAKKYCNPKEAIEALNELICADNNQEKNNLFKIIKIKAYFIFGEQSVKEYRLVISQLDTFQKSMKHKINVIETSLSFIKEKLSAAQPNHQHYSSP